VATTTSKASPTLAGVNDLGLHEAERRGERPSAERRGARVGPPEARPRRELEAELDELLGTARPGEEGIELLDEVSAHMKELFPDEPSAPTGTSQSQAAASRSTPASKAAASRSTPARSPSVPKEGRAPAAASDGDPAKGEGKGAKKKGLSAKEPRGGAASRERARHGARSGSGSTGLGLREERPRPATDEDEDDDWYVD
jgi:hypothetical protein